MTWKPSQCDSHTSNRVSPFSRNCVRTVAFDPVPSTSYIIPLTRPLCIVWRNFWPVCDDTGVVENWELILRESDVHILRRPRKRPKRNIKGVSMLAYSSVHIVLLKMASPGWHTNARTLGKPTWRKFICWFDKRIRYSDDMFEKWIQYHLSIVVNQLEFLLKSKTRHFVNQ